MATDGIATEGLSFEPADSANQKAEGCSFRISDKKGKAQDSRVADEELSWPTSNIIDSEKPTGSAINMNYYHLVCVMVSGAPLSNAASTTLYHEAKRMIREQKRR